MKSGEWLQQLRRRRSLQAATAVGLAGGVVLVVAAAAGGFGAGASHALYSFPNAWGVEQSSAPIGQIWAAGGVPLCTKGGSPVVLTSITPVYLTGQIRLDRILIRHVAPSNTIGLSPDTPVATHRVAGYVIHSPSPCGWRRGSLMYGVVILAARTGPASGYIQGLRVEYTSHGSHGSYVIPFTFGLCGPRQSSDCSPGI